MAKNQVSTPAAPAAIGPYSQGITATGTAVYVSGQLPIDPATGAFPGEDITSQTRQSIENIKAVLAAAGYELSDVVKTTVLLKDIADFERGLCILLYRCLPGTQCLPGGCTAQGCPGRDRGCRSQVTFCTPCRFSHFSHRSQRAPQ